MALTGEVEFVVRLPHERQDRISWLTPMNTKFWAKKGKERRHFAWPPLAWGASLTLLLALGYSLTALYHNTFFS